MRSVRFVSGRLLLPLLGVLALLSGASAVATAQEQGTVITGRVTSEAGGPVGGASVFIRALNVGTQANENGVYRLVVPPSRAPGLTVALGARYIGFRPSSRQVTLTGEPQTINFELAVDVNRLNEVVVTGVTGATERALVPFSVSRVDSTEMRVVAVNPLTQLQGKVPGANIVSNSGRPGSQPAVLLRGPTSINAFGRSQEPLYIVDGVILNGPLPDLNPQDIESVEVVKGAAAGTLYGSQAAAGVIQITTKSGRAAGDGIRFGFRSELGVNDIERSFGPARNHALLLDAAQQRFCVVDAVASSRACSRTIDYRQEQTRINSVPGDTAGIPPAFPIDPGSTISGAILRRTFSSGKYPGQNFNPVDQFVDPRPLVMNNVDVTGRTGSTNFFASLNNTRQGGAVRFLDGYDRSSARLNVGQIIGSRWDMRLNTFYSRSTQDGFNQEEGGRSFFRLTRVPAIVNLDQTDALDRLYIRTNLQNAGVQNENPLYWLQNVEREDVRNRFLGGATLRYAPLEWVDFEGNVSYDRSTLDFKQFRNRGFRTTNNDPTTASGFLWNGAANASSYNGFLQSTIRRELFTNLRSRVNLRALYQQADNDFRNLEGIQLRITDVDAAPNIQDQKVLRSGQTSMRQVSFSGGLNLEYLERYVLDGLVRRDGSSLFGSDNRWQTYGRGSASWLVAREPWWFTPKVSQLTLRGSVGSAGQVPGYTAQYETYTIGAGGTINPLTLGNKLLRPEVKTEAEIGLDFELLSRFGLMANFAQSDIKNQILPVPVAASTGFLQQWQNAGTLQSKTFELSLTVPFIQRRDLTWTGRFNYATNRPTVTKLNVPPFFLGTDLQATNNFIRIAEGERYGNIYGRRFITSCAELPASVAAQCGSGQAFQRNDEGYVVFVGEGHTPGQGITDNLWETFTDVNWANSGSAARNIRTNWGMPIILRDSLGAGRTVKLGNALPQYQASVSQSLTFKRFSAYALLDATVGQSVWNQGRHWSYLDFLGGEVDQSGKSVENAKPLGYFYRSNIENPNGLGGFYDLLQPNSRFVEKASFAKLREVTASYHFGRIAGTGDWTLSLTGRNLKTFTDYRGFDPEIGVGTQTTDLSVANFNNAGSGVINAIDAFSFPNLRSYTFSVNTSF